MLAEFEEKQYEQHLNNALLEDKKLLFPPGQVLEGYLGFDAALFTIHPKFWKHFLCNEYFWPWEKIPKGTVLPKELWQEFEYLIEYLPKFKFNAFIQHKRPEYMSGSRAAEWASWNSPYYRYKLISHQQAALSKLEKTIGNKGVVVYACPAFHTMKEFWAAVEQEKIIDRSNFCQAGKLDNHKVYTFQSPGSYGIAHSEPEKIESYNLSMRLEELSQIEPSASNMEHLVALGDSIHSVLIEVQELSKIYNEIIEFLAKEYKDIKIVVTFSRIYAFRFLTNTDILIGY
jgi:hypothetical protein